MSKYSLFKRPPGGQSSLQHLPVAYMENRIDDTDLNAALEGPPLHYVSRTNSFETKETIEELQRSVSMACQSKNLAQASSYTVWKSPCSVKPKRN